MNSNASDLTLAMKMKEMKTCDSKEKETWQDKEGRAEIHKN
jgi:hypothetical protein